MSLPPDQFVQIDRGDRSPLTRSYKATSGPGAEQFASVILIDHLQINANLNGFD